MSNRSRINKHTGRANGKRRQLSLIDAMRIEIEAKRALGKRLFGPSFIYRPAPVKPDYTGSYQGIVKSDPSW